MFRCVLNVVSVIYKVVQKHTEKLTEKALQIVTEQSAISVTLKYIWHSIATVYKARSTPLCIADDIVVLSGTRVSGSMSMYALCMVQTHCYGNS